MRSFRKECVRACVRDFSGLKDMFQVFDQLVILSRSAESEKAVPADLRDDKV